MDRGFKREQSTVTVFRAANYHNISGGEGENAEEILRHLAANMPPMFGAGDGAMMLLGVNHTKSLHEAGLTKAAIQQKLWEYSRLPSHHFAKSFVDGERVAGRVDGDMVLRTNSPQEVHVIVAGGPGPQDVAIGAGMPQTRLIRET